MTSRILVSGASSGIGARIAVDTGATGADVVLLGRHQERLEEVAGRARTAGAGSATPVTVDLADAGSVLPALRPLAEAGAFDAVISAAGANAALAPSAPADLEGLAWANWHWEGNFRANVLTAVHLIEGLRELSLLMDGAAIVLFSSIAAYRGSGSGSYAGTKAALHPYAYDLAAALGPHKITVNVVAPGYISGTEFFPGGMSPARHEALVGQTLTGRAGVPEDVSGTVQWLISPAARHVTGQIIQVNGGSSLGH